MVTIINVGTGPVVYDEAGHSLGGGERTDVAKLDVIGRRAVELGRLRQEEDPSPAQSTPGKAGDDDSGGKTARRDGKT